MERLRLAYLVLMAVIGFMVFSIIFQTTSQTISPSVTRLAKQDLITAGDEIISNFNIYNPDNKPHHYSYALYLNDVKRFENSVTVNPGKNFVFGGNYRAFEPGRVKITALVYEGEEKKLIDNITYFVSVKPKEEFQ